MGLYEQFSTVLADFGEKMHCDLKLEEGRCTFPIDASFVVNLEYLPDSDCVVLWSIVCTLPEDESAGDRALYLLRLQDMGMGTCGFSIGMDRDDRTLVLHDLRSADELPDADHLAAWLNDLADLAPQLLHDLEEQFPCDADEYIEEENGEEEEDDDSRPRIVVFDDDDANDGNTPAASKTE